MSQSDRNGPQWTFRSLADTFCGLGGIHTPPALNSASAANDERLTPDTHSPWTSFPLDATHGHARAARVAVQKPGAKLRVNITRGERHG